MNLPTLLATKAWRALRREMRLKRGDILSATFGMTYRCNLRCTTCGVWVRGENDTEVELTTEEILSTARQLREMGVDLAILVGSEPLLRRDSLTIVEGMRALGLDVDIITNGTLFTEATAERVVNAGVRAVTISLDGIGENHDRIRGQERAYERSMKGLGRLQAVKARLGADRPKLAVHATISLTNTEELVAISDLSDELGLEVSFQLASETSEAEVTGTQLDGVVVAGEEFIPRGGSFMPDADGVRRIRAFLARPGVLKRHPSLAILSAMTDDDIQAGRFPVHTCNVVEGEILIDPYGHVRPCSHLETYSYGNVREQSVREIWTGARRRRLLEKVRRDMFPICDKCCQHASNLTFWQKGTMLLKALRS